MSFNTIGHVDSRTGRKCVPVSTAYRLPLGNQVYYYTDVASRFIAILNIEYEKEDDNYRLAKKWHPPGRWVSGDTPVYIEADAVAAFMSKNFNEIGHVDPATGRRAVLLREVYDQSNTRTVFYYKEKAEGDTWNVLSDLYRTASAPGDIWGTLNGRKGFVLPDRCVVYVEPDQPLLRSEAAATDENKAPTSQTEQPATQVADSNIESRMIANEQAGIALQATLEAREDRYSKLRAVLEDAFNQAAQGKGAERHSGGNSLRFEDQRILTISRMINSTAGMEFQIIKKVTEALDMPNVEMAKKDLLGAINYIAGCIVFLEERAASEFTSMTDAGVI